MKQKTRKLHLNRETLRNLANDQLRGVAGGITGQPGCTSESQVEVCTGHCGTGRSDCIGCITDVCTESCQTC